MQHILFLFHQYQCLIPFKLFHLGLEFGEFPFYADFHLFDIWGFGLGIHGYGEVPRVNQRFFIYKWLDSIFIASDIS